MRGAGPTFRAVPGNSKRSKAASKLAVFIGLLRASCLKWLEDNAPSMGAALAFYAALSLAPVLIVATAIAGLGYWRSFAETEVLRQIQEAAKRFPSSSNRSELHNLEGEILLAQAKAPDAESAFVAAAQEFAEPLPHAGLARAYETEGQWKAAAQEWEQVLASYGQVLHREFPPDLAYAELQLGRLYRQMNDPAQARQHYERFLQRWQQADDATLLAQANRELSGLT